VAATRDTQDHPGNSLGGFVIPSGTKLGVRVDEALNTDRNEVGILKGRARVILGLDFQLSGQRNGTLGQRGSFRRVDFAVNYGIAARSSI
jgi:hypothetical protein